MVINPKNLAEKLAIQEATSNGSRVIMEGPFGDPKFKASGWQKFEHTHATLSGVKTVVHYMKNSRTGKIAQVKIKLGKTQK